MDSRLNSITAKRERIHKKYFTLHSSTGDLMKQALT